MNSSFDTRFRHILHRRETHDHDSNNRDIYPLKGQALRQAAFPPVADGQGKGADLQNNSALYLFSGSDIL